ncbi:hypothetical protein GALMADRAFT_208780 [Galerina marginata CBS 339.88]|uniref:Uncharacterized protein n=1 Tax=Galerina marginata (strain CBS 339.88) TaxID=685588 RepID=A0A067TAL9_GALM3|nr:hypothetical protein GALMADRAFT_208780 [Galerina marginata CBS 339.88]
MRQSQFESSHKRDEKNAGNDQEPKRTGNETNPPPYIRLYPHVIPDKLDGNMLSSSSRVDAPNPNAAPKMQTTGGTTNEGDEQRPNGKEALWRWWSHWRWQRVSISGGVAFACKVFRRRWDRTIVYKSFARCYVLVVNKIGVGMGASNTANHRRGRTADTQRKSKRGNVVDVVQVQVWTRRMHTLGNDPRQTRHLEALSTCVKPQKSSVKRLANDELRRVRQEVGLGGIVVGGVIVAGASCSDWLSVPHVGLVIPHRYARHSSGDERPWRLIRNFLPQYLQRHGSLLDISLDRFTNSDRREFERADCSSSLSITSKFDSLSIVSNTIIRRAFSQAKGWLKMSRTESPSLEIGGMYKSLETSEGNLTSEYKLGEPDPLVSEKAVMAIVENEQKRSLEAVLSSVDQGTSSMVHGSDRTIRIGRLLDIVGNEGAGISKFSNAGRSQ